MTAIEAVGDIMQTTATPMRELVQYADLGSMSNVMQMLKRSDLKVGSFVKMLEAMGYQLIVTNEEGTDEIVIDE